MYGLNAYNFSVRRFVSTQEIIIYVVVVWSDYSRLYSMMSLIGIIMHNNWQAMRTINLIGNFDLNHLRLYGSHVTLDMTKQGDEPVWHIVYRFKTSLGPPCIQNTSHIL